MLKPQRPRPRMMGKENPAVADKGQSPVGDAARTVPRKLRGTRSQAAGQMMKGY